MSQHLPTTTLQCDVFPATDEEASDAVALARKAWSDITDWVHSGYLPVITVVTEDGTSHDIDLATEKEA